MVRARMHVGVRLCRVHRAIGIQSCFAAVERVFLAGPVAVEAAAAGRSGLPVLRAVFRAVRRRRGRRCRRRSVRRRLARAPRPPLALRGPGPALALRPS